MTRALTRDLGIAFRDFMQDASIHVLKEEDGELKESGEMRDIVGIDVSDADNPVVVLDNGQRFIVRIIAA